MSAISNNINKHIKSLLNGFIIYVETEDNKEVTDYLKTNLKDIQALFESKYKTFIVAANNDLDTNSKDVVSYFYPRINLDILNLSEGNSNQYLLELYGLKNKGISGLLSIDTETTFTDLSNIKIEDLEAFLSKYTSNIYIEDYDELPFSGNDYDENISLDAETQELVDGVIKKFNTLKDNGSFLAILPIIEKYIKENNSNIDNLSRLHIDDNYNIYLPDYNHLEIKLSHLTKSIYLLFLNHPEGIYLKELANYKNELIRYYNCISNRVDFDKMLLSINDVINTETNAIYVHLSRIKSIFTKNIHPTIAENYYIQGGKSKTKKIKLKSSLITWKNPIIERGMEYFLEMDYDDE